MGGTSTAYQPTMGSGMMRSSSGGMPSFSQSPGFPEANRSVSLGPSSTGQNALVPSATQSNPYAGILGGPPPSQYGYGQFPGNPQRSMSNQSMPPMQPPMPSQYSARSLHHLSSSSLPPLDPLQQPPQQMPPQQMPPQQMTPQQGPPQMQQMSPQMPSPQPQMPSQQAPQPPSRQASVNMWDDFIAQPQPSGPPTA